jgi:hypothetical protein
LPLPFAPELIVSHAALLVAVHPQPVPAVTETLPVAPAGVVRFDEPGETVNAHGAPACVTANVWPAIITVPVRDAVLALAPTL